MQWEIKNTLIKCCTWNIYPKSLHFEYSMNYEGWFSQKMRSSVLHNVTVVHHLVSKDWRLGHINVHKKQNICLLQREHWTDIAENAVWRMQYFWDLPKELSRRLTPNAHTTDKPKPNQLNQEQYCFLVNGQNCLTNTNTTKLISFCGNHYNTIKKKCISIILCVIIVQTL